MSVALSAGVAGRSVEQDSQQPTWFVSIQPCTGRGDDNALPSVGFFDELAACRLPSYITRMTNPWPAARGCTEDAPLDNSVASFIQLLQAIALHCCR